MCPKLSLKTPQVRPPWSHADCGTHVGYKCRPETAVTSADLAEEYGAVLVAWHETVKNHVLKTTVAAFSYRHHLQVLAGGKSLRQETTEAQQPARTQHGLGAYLCNEGTRVC